MKWFLLYGSYLLVSIWLTIRVGNSLHKHGRVWIIDLLRDEILSDKINNLLLLGYRLVNIGYILLTLMVTNVRIEATQHVFEFYGMKLGIIITILAWLHYQNIAVLVLFSKLKSKYKWQL